MSTHCTIIVRVKDTEEVLASRVHYEGRECLRTLQDHYGSEKLANKLIKLGDMICLRETIQDSEFRGRDRREKSVGPNRYQNLQMALYRQGVTYNYYFDGNEWRKV